MSLRFAPPSRHLDLLIRALAPLSHHDAARQTDSNRLLFNRQKQMLSESASPRRPTQAEMDETCARHPVPAVIAEYFGDLTFAEFVAAAVVRCWLAQYGGGDGAGLFSTPDRYPRLVERLTDAAKVAPTLRRLWDRLCAILQVPIHDARADHEIFRLVSVPALVQQAALRAMQEQAGTIVALARVWADTAKRQSIAYAERAGVEPVDPSLVTLSYAAEAILPGVDGARVADVPTVSVNALRHGLVREPAWWHLCAALDLPSGTMPGVPLGVEALFENGGNLRSGAKEPTAADDLAHRIRAHYPVLDLLGGNCDSFGLGESRLIPAAWIVARENAEALAGTPAAALPEARGSVFDLLDDVTLTRQASSGGLHQMIFSLESLAPGTLLFMRLRLAPWTPPLTAGALWCAIETARAQRETIGGQSARGFGAVAIEYCGETSEWERDGAAYEAALDADREALRAGLTSGELGTGSVLLAA